MENENKHSKFKQIIFIFLFGILFGIGLIFMVLSPIAFVCRDKLVDNNTQLVKRGVNIGGSTLVGENGETSIYFFDKDVTTIYSSWKSFDIPRDVDYYNTLINGGSISGINDVFGYGIFNYFRFKYNSNYSNKMNTPTSNWSNIYNLEYYIQLTNDTFYTFTLGYYDIVIDDLIYFTPVSDLDFEQFNIIPTYNILTFAYIKNEQRLTQLEEFLQTNIGSNNLLYIWENFQLDSRFIDKYTSDVTYVVFDKDFVTPLVDAATSSGFSDGYNEGYKIGLDDASQSSVFSVLQRASSSISSFLNIEVLPNLSLWLLISIPFSISIMVILLRLLRGGS